MGLVEVEAGEVRHAIGGDKDVRGIEQLVSLAALHRDADAHRAGLDGGDGRVRRRLTPSSLTRFSATARKFGVEAGEHRAILDHRHFRAEAAIGLRPAQAPAGHRQ